MIRPAQRSQAKPLIGLYSESGGGKTHSALMIARGFVGPAGRICMIETEQGRGEAFADLLPGGYDVSPLRSDFSPQNFHNALKEVEAAGYGAVIIDSASLEWQGEGGVLDMADKNRQAGMKGVLMWQRPKMDHARHFVIPLLQTAVPLVIVCMRARYPMVEETRNGKKEWVRSPHLDPIQSDDILFELFVHGWLDAEHRLHVTRYGRPDLAQVIYDKEAITIDTGARLAAWAASSPLAATMEAKPTERLLAEARTAALGGRAELRKWYRKLNAASREVINPMVDELGAEADAADAKRSDTPPEKAPDRDVE